MTSRIDENLTNAEVELEDVENGDSDRNPRDVKSRTIGQVLSQLDLEFPGISASKIRFLEERGLVHPSRTETGYRKYSQTDIERLRYILTMQRDHYMPLKVIRQHLEDLEAGRVLNSMPATVSEDVLDSVLGPDEQEGRTYTLRELAEYANTTPELIRELIDFGLLEDGSDVEYTDYDVLIARVSAELTQHGIQPRHLRAFKSAADREISLVEIAVAPLASRRDAPRLRRRNVPIRFASCACSCTQRSSNRQCLPTNRRTMRQATGQPARISRGFTAPRTGFSLQDAPLTTVNPSSLYLAPAG